MVLAISSPVSAQRKPISPRACKGGSFMRADMGDDMEKTMK